MKLLLSLFILSSILITYGASAEPVSEELYKDVPYFKECHSPPEPGELGPLSPADLCKAKISKPPQEVNSHIEEMMDSCRGIGGKPAPLTFKPLGPVHLSENLDLWIIDEGNFQCDGARSLYSGSGGSRVEIYWDLKNGHAKEIFSHGAYGAFVEKSGTLSKIWLRVGGELCGQTGEFSHAEAWACERPLVWDPEKNIMDFGPPNQIRTRDNLR